MTAQAELHPSIVSFIQTCDKKIFAIMEASKYQALTVYEYCKLADPEFKDKLYVDEMYNIVANPLNRDKLIYIKDQHINWFGYDSDDNNTNRKHFLARMRSLLTENKDYYLIKRDDFEVFKDGKSWSADVTDFRYINSIKLAHYTHIAITQQAFEILALSGASDKHKKIRMQFVYIKQLFQDYVIYQQYHKQLMQIIDFVKVERIKNNELKALEEIRALDLKKKEDELKTLEETRALEIKKKEDELKSQQLAMEKLQKELEELKLSTTYKTPVPITEKKSVIYCISTESKHKQHIYKIGRTDNIHRRVSELSTGNHETIKIYYKIEVYSALMIERYLHHCLAATRLSDDREFFNCHLDRIKQVFEIAKYIDQHAVDTFNSGLMLDLKQIPAIEFRPVEYSMKVKKEEIKPDEITVTKAKEIVVKLRLDMTKYNTITDKIAQDEFIRLLSLYYKPKTNIETVKNIARLADISHYINWKR